MTSIFHLDDVVTRFGGQDALINNVFNEQDALEYIPLGLEIKYLEQGPDDNPESQVPEPLQEENNDVPDLNQRTSKREQDQSWPTRLHQTSRLSTKPLMRDDVRQDSPPHQPSHKKM